MRHTYLFREGVWKAKGFYFDEKGDSVPIEGTSRITHTRNRWINESHMRLLANEGFKFQNRYELVPFPPNGDFTTWSSANPLLGQLFGKLILVEDSILSVYQTEDGKYSGLEYLEKVNKTFYRNRGALVGGEKKLSSWSVELRRTNDSR
jgi:hypothetical protein